MDKVENSEMKYLKRMKKSTKVGLISSAVYAAGAFALPAFANTVEQPVFQPVNLAEITTVEQADNVYQHKLVEYALDKKLNIREISNLSRVLDKKWDLLTEAKNELQEKYKPIMNKKSSLESELASCDSGFAVLEEQKQYDPSIIEKIKKELDEKVISHYPSLFEKQANIVYSANMEIKPELVSLMKEQIKAVHRLNIRYHDDKSLEILSNQGSYTISDLVSFYQSLEKYKFKSSSFNGEVGKAKEAELVKKQARLRKELNDVVNSEDLKNFSIQLSDLEAGLEKLTDPRSKFSGYLAKKEDIEEFKRTHRKGDLSRYVAVTIDYAVSFKKKYGFYPNSSESSFNDSLEVEFIKNYFKAEKGLDISVERLKDPTRTKIPTNWNFLLGFGLPIFRNVLIKKYIGHSRKEDHGYCASVWAGIFNGLFGTILLDIIAPWFWWFRMVGTPVIIQPLKSWMIRSMKDDKKN